MALFIHLENWVNYNTYLSRLEGSCKILRIYNIFRIVPNKINIDCEYFIIIIVIAIVIHMPPSSELMTSILVGFTEIWLLLGHQLMKQSSAGFSQLML